MAYRERIIPMRTRGVTQVCFNAYLFHCWKRLLAFRRFEKGFLRSLSFCAYSTLAGFSSRSKAALTLIVRGEGGLISNVARAGALVSPALISPPSPLDFLRDRGLPVLLGPEKGPNLSLVVDRSGNASVAGMMHSEACDQGGDQYDSLNERAVGAEMRSIQEHPRSKIE